MGCDRVYQEPETIDARGSSAALIGSGGRAGAARAIAQRGPLHRGWDLDSGVGQSK